MKIAFVVPHMFMHDAVIHDVIFAPGTLAIDLVNKLTKRGHEVTFFSPGFTHKSATNINSDLSYINQELEMRGYGLTELLKKHPLLFITLARQAQSEIISEAIARANSGEFDLIHFFTNEEEIALEFSRFSKIPVVFTHHEPFNFLAKYRNSFFRHKDKNWISISFSQRKSMPEDANFIANIYNGIEKDLFLFNDRPDEYFAYFGRIIEPKGVDIAIAAAKKAGVALKIAGKHYSGFGNDKYWEEVIEPQIDGGQIQYLGFIDSIEKKQEFLGNARALLMPSTWEEPFGMVMIEALACGTPIIGLNSGSIPEIVKGGKTGYIAEKTQTMDPQEKELEIDKNAATDGFVQKILGINNIDREVCRRDFETRFTIERMCKEHENVYTKLMS